MVTKQQIVEQINHLKCGVSDGFTSLVNTFSDEELCNRRNFVGHITASGTIIHLPSREVLVLHHKILNKWLVPGGHVDIEDDSPLSAALREVEEETGLTHWQLRGVNICDSVQYCVEINSHPIPRNDKKNEDAHYHHDFRFVFLYDGDKDIKIDTNESLNYKWVSVNDPSISEFLNHVENL